MLILPVNIEGVDYSVPCYSDGETLCGYLPLDSVTTIVVTGPPSAPVAAKMEPRWLQAGEVRQRFEALEEAQYEFKMMVAGLPPVTGGRAEAAGEAVTEANARLEAVLGTDERRAYYQRLEKRWNKSARGTGFVPTAREKADRAALLDARAAVASAQSALWDAQRADEAAADARTAAGIRLGIIPPWMIRQRLTEEEIASYGVAR